MRALVTIPEQSEFSLKIAKNARHGKTLRKSLKCRVPNPPRPNFLAGQWLKMDDSSRENPTKAKFPRAQIWRPTRKSKLDPRKGL